MKTKKSILFATNFIAWRNSLKRFAHVAIGITPSSHFRTFAFALLVLAASTGMVQAQNLIANGDFASGTTGWTGNNFSVVSGEAFISSSNSGGNLWDTQLVKGGMSFTVSTQYTLTFRARAAANRNITVAIQNVGVWTDQFRQQYSLTTTMQTFTSTFTSTSANANVQIGFLMAAQSSTAAVYYDDVSIITANPPTLAATTAATSITTTSAVSGGNVTSQGGGSVTARGVVWSTSTTPTVALSTKTTDGSGTGSFTSNITGLSSGVKYYVRSYATNSSGTAYGAEISFTTLDTEVPTAFTATKGAVTFNSVELLLNATDNSGSVNYTISYGSGPTVVNTTGTSGVQKSYIITGLTASTDYTFSVSAKDASNNTASNSPIAVQATTTENTNTECSGTLIESEKTFNYTFTTTGTDVTVTFELVTPVTGIIAYAQTYNPGFAEVGMTNIGGQKFSKTFTGQAIGATFKVACKFAWAAGGILVTTQRSYTVGNACLTVPGKPTSAVATPGNSKASIAFTAPASNGGSAITGYTVTSSPGGLTGTGASSPLVVSNLENGTAYTFTVTATNAQGTGAASTASNSATPHATNNIITVSTSSNISALTLTAVSDVVVNNDALLTINQATSINSITVAAGGMVTNTSTFNTPTLTINSNGTDGTGTYINTGTSNVTTLTANQYLGTTRNWYISSPVVSTASSATNIARYYEYVEAGNNADLAVTGSTAYWKGYNPGHTMLAGKGYIALPSASDASVTFSGTMNTGNVSIPLSKSLAGYNLIGNPYPCHLTWTEAFATANASKIYPTIWVRTNSGSSNANGWSFSTHNALVGETVPSWANVVIAPMQAFWVKAKIAEQTLVLNSDLLKSHQASNPLKAPAAKKTDRQRVRLQVSNGTATDEALIYFDTAASNTFDDYDSPKYAESASVTQIYSIIGDEKLVINGMNAIVLDSPISVGFVPGNATAFSIKANELSNLPLGVNVILKDNATLAETDLTDGTALYNFLPATTIAGRFSLIFRSAEVSTSIENANKLDTQVFVNIMNQISIIAPVKSNYAIYNAMGQLIENGAITSNSQTLNFKLTAGVYLVKVNNQSTRVIIK